MVTVVKKDHDGIEELQEKAIQFNRLIENVFIVASGCDNAEELVKHLMVTYVAVSDLKKAIIEMQKQ